MIHTCFVTTSTRREVQVTLGNAFLVSKGDGFNALDDGMAPAAGGFDQFADGSGSMSQAQVGRQAYFHAVVVHCSIKTDQLLQFLMMK